MIVFAGADLNAQFTNTTLAYNATSDFWSDVSATNSPDPRTKHGAASDGETIYIFGHKDASGEAWKETWEYGINANFWAEREDSSRQFLDGEAQFIDPELRTSKQAGDPDAPVAEVDVAAGLRSAAPLSRPR